MQSISEIRKHIAIVVKNEDKGSVDASFGVILRYAEPLIGKLLARFRLPSSEVDDMRQIMAMALFGCLANYDGRANIAGFFYRVLFNIACTELKKKYYTMPDGKAGLKRPHSLDVAHTDNEECTLGEILIDHKQPEADYTLIKRESLTRLLAQLTTILSPSEQAILTAYCNLTRAGRFTYTSIGEEIYSRIGVRMNYKQIDNGLNRIRVKAKRIVASSTLTVDLGDITYMDFKIVDKPLFKKGRKSKYADVIEAVRALAPGRALQIKAERDLADNIRAAIYHAFKSSALSIAARYDEDEGALYFFKLGGSND